MVMRRSNQIPLYWQLYEDLRSSIESGHYKVGDQLPTEADLSRAYSVSRITVKHALRLLVQDNLVERIQGKGTFVCQPKFDRTLGGLISFRDEIARRGMRPSSRLLELKVVPVSPKIGQQLRLDPLKEVIKIKRLRLADDEIMGLQTSYIPYDLCPELLKKEQEIAEGSLYAVLGQYGLIPARADETYSIGYPDFHDAKAMGIPEGTAVFYVERLTLLADNTPIEVVYSLLRGDRYKLRVKIDS
jgi:GntR family transcriptional regulator